MAAEGVMGPDIIPFGIAGQSHSVFCPTGGPDDNPKMDNLRANLRRLIGETPVLTVGNQSGVGQSWLQRYLAGTIRKANLEKVQLLAAYFGVPAHRLLNDDLSGVGGQSHQSPRLRLDPVTLSRAYRELVELFARGGAGAFDPRIESHSAVLCHLYDVLLANGGQLSLAEGHELVEFVREQVRGGDEARRDGAAKRGAGDGGA